ncbi:MAG: AbrB/MazE/SpoVT family DNA-binding domain-containing protein [Candidatus Njordarchaeota archaeon]
MAEAFVKNNAIILPREIMDLLGLSEGDMLEVRLENGNIVLEPLRDPFKILEEVLGDFTYNRRARTEAEKYLFRVADQCQD